MPALGHISPHLSVCCENSGPPMSGPELISGLPPLEQRASQIGTHSGLSEDLKDLTRKPEILSSLHFDSVYKHRYWEEEGEGEGEEDIIDVTTVGLKIRGQPGNIDT